MRRRIAKRSPLGATGLLQFTTGLFVALALVLFLAASLWW